MKKLILLLGVLIIVAVCVGGLWYWQMHAQKRFSDAYIAYAALSDIHQNDAYTPGAATNPLRQELNETLARSLARETNTKERLALASHGVVLLDELTKEVDAIGNSAAPVSVAIGDLRAAAGDLGNIRHRGDMQALVELAEKQLTVIQDIRGYSYRANFETAQIFKRIISDQGVLKDSYVIELNSQLPVVEEQFNRRSNLYMELEDNVYRVHQKFDILSGVS